jgi:hypothetical protein
VPTKDTIVEKHATKANELKEAIISFKANTRSGIESLECTSTDTITPDIASVFHQTKEGIVQ